MQLNRLMRASVGGSTLEELLQRRFGHFFLGRKDTAGLNRATYMHFCPSASSGRLHESSLSSHMRMVLTPNTTPSLAFKMAGSHGSCLNKVSMSNPPFRCLFTHTKTVVTFVSTLISTSKPAWSSTIATISHEESRRCRSASGAPVVTSIRHRCAWGMPLSSLMNAKSFFAVTGLRDKKRISFSPPGNCTVMQISSWVSKEDILCFLRIVFC
jgi:hypothetical protein